jgi:hypothetical protein
MAESGYVEVVGLEADSLGVFVGAKGRFVGGSRAGRTIDVVLERGHWPQLCEGDVVAVETDDPDREPWRATRLVAVGQAHTEASEDALIWARPYQ